MTLAWRFSRFARCHVATQRQVHFFVCLTEFGEWRLLVKTRRTADCPQGEVIHQGQARARPEQAKGDAVKWIERQRHAV